MTAKRKPTRKEVKAQAEALDRRERRRFAVPHVYTPPPESAELSAVLTRGPLPRYPFATPEENEALYLALKLEASKGTNKYLTAFRCGVPYRTLMEWAGKCGELRRHIADADDLRRAVNLEEGRKGMGTPGFNGNTFKHYMQFSHEDLRDKPNETHININNETKLSDDELARRVAHTLEKGRLQGVKPPALLDLKAEKDEDKT
jgi:hypothetical protein